MLALKSKYKIWFYLDEEGKNVFYPNNIHDFWGWLTTTSGLSKMWGRYHWVLQTYLYFKKFNIDCQLTNQFPDDGVVITHRDCLKNDFSIKKERFVICLLVDRKVPHPYANYHVLHNPIQALRFHSNYIYIPPWPQVSLKKRSVNRKHLFENIGFFGYKDNIVPDLNNECFFEELRNLNMTMSMISPNKWNDFSHIDVVLSVRGFGKDDRLLHKPALKLFNAWLANLPIIVGYETACRVEGQVGLDYLEALTVEDVINNLKLLKDNIDFRDKIVMNGSRKATLFSPEIIIKRWKDLITEHIEPSFENWRRVRLYSDAHRVISFFREKLSWRLPDDLQTKIK